MNEGETELLAAVARVVGAFDSLGVDYLIGGSIASSIFGEPRQILGANLVARLLPPNAEGLARLVSREFYADLGSIQTAIRDEGCFNFIHLEAMTKVDVFVRWRSAFGQSQFARRQEKAVAVTPPLELFFASPEDTVLAKLE